MSIRSQVLGVVGGQLVEVVLLHVVLLALGQVHDVGQRVAKAVEVDEALVVVQLQVVLGL